MKKLLVFTFTVVLILGIYSLGKLNNQSSQDRNNPQNRNSGDLDDSYFFESDKTEDEKEGEEEPESEIKKDLNIESGGSENNIEQEAEYTDSLTGYQMGLLTSFPFENLTISTETRTGVYAEVDRLIGTENGWYVQVDYLQLAGESEGGNPVFENNNPKQRIHKLAEGLQINNGLDIYFPEYGPVIEPGRLLQLLNEMGNAQAETKYYINFKVESGVITEMWVPYSA